MHVYDTHLHLLYPDVFSYPWCSGLDALNHAFHLETYVAALNATKGNIIVTGAAFMEVDVPEAQQDEEAHFFSRKASSKESLLTAVIAACRPESHTFEAQIEKLAASESIRGVRRILHTSDDSLSQSTRFVDNLNRLATYSLSFDLCLRVDQFHLGIALADRCPDVQFILNHCGIPSVAAQNLDPWRADLRVLAKRPNVACKISGIPAYADASLPLVPQLRPFVEHAVSVFGWDRVMWGSDWPVCNMTFGLSGWLDATHELFAQASESERAKFGTENARRFYRLP